MNGITLGYCNVHSVYQLALAASESGQLDQFYCSMLDAPGKWGGRMSQIFGQDAMTSWRCPGLPPDLITEYPWPLLRHLVYERCFHIRPFDWFITNEWFDRYVSVKLKTSSSRLFVGAETCAQYSFEVAKERGMQILLDCEQVHPEFLWSLLARACDDLNLPTPAPINTPAMAARKRAEYDLADVILVLSEVERRSFIEQGFAPERLIDIPLWADKQTWFPPGFPLFYEGKAQPLRALFVGGIDLRKGVPYLLRAAHLCGEAVELSLVGKRDNLMEPFLHKYQSDFKYFPPRTKPELRKMLWQSDVLVLPSLVDTFGLVAMEAMACGVAVIVTENCGVPVPDPSWRVPIMHAEALATRLMLYVEDRELCREHGKVAAKFARQYQPENYRSKVAHLFGNLLEGKQPNDFPDA